jgi:hypothetical protein
MQERSRLRVGRFDLFHLSAARSKLQHIGNADGADSFDFILAHVWVRLEQLPRSSSAAEPTTKYRRDGATVDQPK